MINRLMMVSALVMNASIHSASAQTPGRLPAPEPIAAPAQPDAVPLYASPKSGSAGEQWETFAGSRIVRNVVDPTLTPVLPEPSKANGSAVIVAPGGAFLRLSIDNEGFAVAHWLADRSIAAFVLKYRLKESPRDPNAYATSLIKLPQDLAKPDHEEVTTPAAAIEDGRAAVRIVRSRATEWKVDTARVGFLGFSAGAMLTLSIGVDLDHTARPDFIAPIYGPLGPMAVPNDAPPMFAAVAADDPLLGKGGFTLVSQWRQANRPVEFHYFEKGGHGFGMRTQGTTSDLWIEEFYTWMKDRGLMLSAKN